MGLCCNTDSQTNNEYENFYRDILSSYPKFSYDSLIDKINKLIDTSNLSKPNETIFFSEIKYFHFKNNFLKENKENHFFILHKFLLPDWTVIWDIGYKNNLSANLIIWSLPYLTDRTDSFRYTVIKEIIQSESQLNITSFIEFIWIYIDICLIYTNKTIIKSILFLAKEQVKSIDCKFINQDMIEQMEKIYLTIKDERNRKEFKGNIENEVMRIYNKYKQQEGDFSEEMFFEFSCEFYYIWDMCLLREYYFNYVNRFINCNKVFNE